jgi:hypothetical protein
MTFKKQNMSSAACLHSSLSHLKSVGTWKLVKIVFPKSMLYMKTGVIFQEGIGIDGVSAERPQVGGEVESSQAGDSQEEVVLARLDIVVSMWGVGGEEMLCEPDARSRGEFVVLDCASSTLALWRTRCYECSTAVSHAIKSVSESDPAPCEDVSESSSPFVSYISVIEHVASGFVL